MHRRHFLKLSATAAASLAAPAVSTTGWAQAYPTRPVRIIVPFGPGGPTDIPARFIAQRLTENLGRNFLVENVAGASSNIGTAQAARMAPDGYSILITVNNLVINPSLFEKVAFDPYKDFDPVVLAVAFSSAFSVHPSVPAKTVKELIEVIRANPGKYSYASPGTRHAVASARRAVPRHPQSRHRACSLWRQRPGDHRDDLGSHADLLRLDHGGRAAGERR